MNTLHYAGQELDLFAKVANWKRYWSSRVQPYVSGDVLEVGAGLGVNTPLLNPGSARSWTSIEPDPVLAERLSLALAANPETRTCKVLTGTIEGFDPQPQFDSLVYIDVLEHIKEDREELARASALLRPGGHIVVLSPAHQWLYTPFDKAIGHFRRYNRRSLLRCTPPSCQIERLFYLDSAGMLASLANKLLLRRAMPKRDELLVWDRFLVPASTILDRLLLNRLGKSVIGVWKRSG